MLPSIMREPAWFIAAAVALVALGALLRVWGIDFGLPFLYHTDEVPIVSRALRVPAGELNPH